MTKKIVKVVVHYSDGTVEDISNQNIFQPAQPVVPPVYPGQPISTCSLCGIRLDTVMGYVCSRINCPTGMGPTVC